MELKALAKINLTLEVLGCRDDGFHEVRTVMQTIDLADDLVIEPWPSIRVDCDNPLLQGEANLVWQAARTLSELLGPSAAPGARVYIRKRIPVGMGLGGGSADAAAALLGLNRLWGLGLSRQELGPIAAGLGSDVCFFLDGGSALAEGRGEIVTPLPDLPHRSLLLFCPRVAIDRKTAAMYSMLTPEHYSGGEATGRLVQRLCSGQLGPAELPGLTCNVFEAVAHRVFPQFDEIRTRLEGLGVGPARLAGAGPGGFCFPSTEAEFQAASNALHTLGVGVYRVNTVAGAPR